MFSDEALNAAVESSLAPSKRRRLNQLSHAGGQRLLSAAESAELTHLVDLYDRAVLRRAGLWLSCASRVCCGRPGHLTRITWRRELSPQDAWSSLCARGQVSGVNTATCQNSTGQRCQMDHMTPRIRGGKTEPDNLCLACAACNSFKLDRIEAADPESAKSADLFNPRMQNWHDHFAWSADGSQIVASPLQDAPRYQPR